MKDLETMQREGREKVYKDIIYWVMNPSAREAIFTPKEANDVIDQHTANTWKACKDAILESGLLEEKEEHQDWCKLTGELEYSSCGCWKDHNTLARNIKAHLDELIKQRKKNPKDICEKCMKLV